MLTDRQTQLLDFVIREYVRTAEPVGSALVCEKGDFSVSPATIRNEMNELEAQGYLAQPHTSAGRIPTDKAYRLFVNTMLAEGRYGVDPRHKRRIDSALSAAGDSPHELNKNAAQIIADLSDSLVITNVADSGNFYKTGLSSLFEFPEFRQVRRVLGLTDFFDHFDELFDRIQEAFFRELDEGAGFRISIGRENPFRNIQDETVIVAQYRLPGRYEGSMTIIGPIRMDYRKNIGLVSYTAEALNKRANHE